MHEIEVVIKFKDGEDFFEFEADSDEDAEEWVDSFLHGHHACDCKRAEMFDRTMRCGNKTKLISLKVDGVECT